MHKRSTSSMGKTLRVFTQNHGTQIDFGRSKSVRTSQLYNVTNLYFVPVHLAGTC
jgi:hypothetical protein